MAELLLHALKGGCFEESVRLPRSSLPQGSLAPVQRPFRKFISKRQKANRGPSQPGLGPQLSVSPELGLGPGDLCAAHAWL